MWIQHRIEKKNPLTPTAAKQQVKRFAAWGQPRSIAAIEYTVAQGWQGIREPETNGAPHDPDDLENIPPGTPLTSEQIKRLNAQRQKEREEYE